MLDLSTCDDGDMNIKSVKSYQLLIVDKKIIIYPYKFQGKLYMMLLGTNVPCLGR